MDLVLSSGFLAFASHCGFLAAIEAHGGAVDACCGTSSGALVGALWSAGMPAGEILALTTGRRPIAWCTPHLAPWRGLFRLDAMIAELERHLPPTFDALPRPLSVGVVDGDAHRLLSSGALAPAVAASCAVPLLFAPVEVGGRLHVDGAKRDRLPVPLHAFFKISFTTRQGFVSVMRSSWPLWK